MVDYPDGGDEERRGDVEAAGEGIERIQVKIRSATFPAEERQSQNVHT